MWRYLVVFLTCACLWIGVSDNFPHFKYAYADGESIPTGPGYIGEGGAGVNFAPGGGSSYQGPGDVVSGASVWYSCGRAYNAAYATGSNGACDVVDTATGLVTCTYHIQTSGFVNPSECTGAGQSCYVACSVTKAYDQTGGGNPAVQATLANMPTLTFSALNGLPCPTGTQSSSQYLSTASGVTLNAGSTTLTAVSEVNTSASGYSPMIGTNAIGIVYATYQSPNTDINLYAGSLGSKGVTNVFHAAVGIIAASGNSNLVIDGTANSVSSGNANSTGQIGYLGQGGGGNYGGGTACEIGAWPIAFNSTQYGNMNTNMHSASNGWNF
jgi:hypothetical protein